MFFTYQTENTFTPQMLERMDLFEERYTNSTFDKAVGAAQAEQVIKELGIADMSLSSEEQVLGFHRTAIQREVTG